VSKRIPELAFEYYAGLGPGRSYDAVAIHFNASKRGIAKLAQREDWQGRLERAEHEARERSQAKVIESLEEMNDRHLKMAMIVQQRAIEALRSAAMEDPVKAAQALVRAIQLERMLRGNAGEQEEADVMDIVREEGRKLLQWVEIEHDADADLAADGADDDQPTASGATALEPADGEAP
jgi:hypothetical protein